MSYCVFGYAYLFVHFSILKQNLQDIPSHVLTHQLKCCDFSCCSDSKVEESEVDDGEEGDEEPSE